MRHATCLAVHVWQSKCQPSTCIGLSKDRSAPLVLVLELSPPAAAAPAAAAPGTAAAEVLVLLPLGLLGAGSSGGLLMMPCSLRPRALGRAAA